MQVTMELFIIVAVLTLIVQAGILVLLFFQLREPFPLFAHCRLQHIAVRGQEIGAGEQLTQARGNVAELLSQRREFDRRRFKRLLAAGQICL